MPEYPPTTTLPGLLFELPFEDIPSPLIPKGRLPLLLLAPSATDVGLATVGVLFGVPLGVACKLSVGRDFREEDRGVILLLMSALTGVERSSLVALLLTVMGVLLRIDLGVGVAGLRWWAASLGVIGDLTLRLLASAGTKGRAGLAWLSRDLFGVGVGIVS